MLCGSGGWVQAVVVVVVVMGCFQHGFGGLERVCFVTLYTLEE